MKCNLTNIIYLHDALYWALVSIYAMVSPGGAHFFLFKGRAHGHSGKVVLMNARRTGVVILRAGALQPISAYREPEPGIRGRACTREPGIRGRACTGYVRVCSRVHRV
jgi:hypothetical protein